MAGILTKKKLEDADIDVGHAGEAVNEEKVVKTRLGRSFKSIPLIVKEGEAKITQAAQTITSATASIVAQKNQASAAISQAESDVVTAATDVRQQGNQEITNLQNAINIAAAAGAGENGWTAQLIVDGDKTQKQINDEIKAINELQALHNKASAVFTDYLTPNEIANSTTTNLAAKLQDINDKKVISKLRLTGKYYINSLVTFNRDFEWDQDPDSKFILGPNGGIVFEGSATLIGKPTANISNSSKVISLVNTLKPYDLICIYNPTPYSFSPHKSDYKAGEFAKVSAATGTTVTLFGRTYEDYVSTDVDIYKINPIKISFNRFNVDATLSTVATPVKFTFCKDISADQYANLNSLTAAVTLDRCFNVEVNSPVATNMSELTGTNYGVSIGNSQIVRINGGDVGAIRHCVSGGGGSGICSVPCRELIISNMTLKNGSTTNISSADFHGNVAESKYIDCVMDGLSLAGKNNTIQGCTIIGRSIDGMCISIGEILGGHLNLIDCDLIVNSPITANFGVISIALEKDLVSDLVINIRNMKINGKSVAPYHLFRAVGAENTPITKKITIIVDGLICTLANHGAILNIQGGLNYEILPDVEIDMRNINTIKKGIYYVHPTTTATAPSTKYNLPTQKGSGLITTASEANGIKLGSVITFPYYYPVPPSVIHSVGTDGTWTVDSTFNLKPISTVLSTNTPTQLRFALISPAALPARTFKVSYQVGL